MSDEIPDNRTHAKRPRRNRWRYRGSKPGRPPSARSGPTEKSCTTAAMISMTWPRYATFEEVAHLLVHEELPNAYELIALQAKAGIDARAAGAAAGRAGSRSPPRPSRWMCCAPAARCWARSCPSATTSTTSEARNIADRLLAIFPSMLIYWYHYARNGHADRGRNRRGIDRRALPAPVDRAHSRPSCYVRALDVSLILYAEHEFNASTFTTRVIAGTGSDMYSAHHRGDRRAARVQTRRGQ